MRQRAALTGERTLAGAWMDEQLKQAIALGREHYEKREYDKAERHLRKVIASGLAFADIHNMIGVISHDRGKLDEARDAFKRALEINPRYTEAALNLAVTYNDLGDYELAQQVYRGAIQRDARGVQEVDPFAKGKIANLHAELAHAYLEVDMPNEAVQEYRSAIRLCPQFADIRVKLAEVYRQMGDLVAARYELEEAMRQRPDYGPSRAALGVLLLISGQRKEAMRVWEEALRRDPHNKAAEMYLRMAHNPPSRPSRRAHDAGTRIADHGALQLRAGRRDRRGPGERVLDCADEDPADVGPGRPLRSRQLVACALRCGARAPKALEPRAPRAQALRAAAGCAWRRAVVGRALSVIRIRVDDALLGADRLARVPKSARKGRVSPLEYVDSVQTPESDSSGARPGLMAKDWRCRTGSPQQTWCRFRTDIALRYSL